MRETASPIGVVLAGGRGLRMGGSKATVQLRGRPLIEYPLQALRSVLDEVVVIAKADSELPPMASVTVWLEPEEPRHPLVGILEALALADGRSVLVCPVDLPLISPALITRLARADRPDAPATIVTCQGADQPLLGLYRPPAAALLAPAARAGTESVRAAVASLEPARLEVADPDELFNVNSPEDLIVAQAMLEGG